MKEGDLQRRLNACYADLTDVEDDIVVYGEQLSEDLALDLSLRYCTYELNRNSLHLDQTGDEFYLQNIEVIRDAVAVLLESGLTKKVKDIIKDMSAVQGIVADATEEEYYTYLKSHTYTLALFIPSRIEPEKADKILQNIRFHDNYKK